MANVGGKQYSSWLEASLCKYFEISQSELTIVIRKKPANSYGYELNIFITSKSHEVNHEFVDECAKCLELPVSILRAKRLNRCHIQAMGRYRENR